MNIIESYNWNHHNKYFKEVFGNCEVTTVLNDGRFSIYKVDNIVFCPRWQIPYVCELYSEPLVLVVTSNMGGDDDLILYKKDNCHYVINNSRRKMAVSKSFEISKNIFKIYATNLYIYDSQHVALPYGVQSLIQNYNNINKNIKATKLCYVNFKLQDRLHRQQVIEQIKHYDHITIDKYDNDAQPQTYVNYYNKLQEYWFIASPEGLGPECYRTWESLYLNRFPIVDKTDMTKHFEDLPIVRVDDWSKLTASFLNEELSRLQTSKFNLNKLDHKWWWQQIKQTAEEIRK